MAKDHRESTIKSLLEAHLDELKKISEGIQGILVVQKRMEVELAGLRPIKEEWPVVRKAIIDTNKRVQNIDDKVDDLDKKVSSVLPDHEVRITRLEHKPV